MSINGAKIYFTIPLFGGIHITQTTVSLIVVTLLLCISGILLGRNLTKRPGKMQVLTEKIISMLRNLVCEVMGKHNEHFTPMIGTLFVLSMVGSLIGLTGFLRSTTADLSVVLTWAVMVSVYIWYRSIKENGFMGWLKGFTEPIWVMTPMNIVSEIAQPISMAFRHFGNVFGGGVIMSLIYSALAGLSSLLLNLIASNGVLLSLVFVVIGVGLYIMGIKARKLSILWKLLGVVVAMIGGASLLEALGTGISIPLFQIGLPAVLSLYFDLFSGFIQAFVFCLLTMVYISGACPPPVEEKDTDTAAEA